MKTPGLNHEKSIKQHVSAGYILAEGKNGCYQPPGDASAILCTEGRKQKRSLGELGRTPVTSGPDGRGANFETV